MEYEEEQCSAKGRAIIDENATVSTKKKLVLYSCLPQELVTEILSKLSVISLQRFRSVCKSWNSMITGQDDAHLVRNRLNHATDDCILSLSYFWREFGGNTKTTPKKTPILYYPSGAGNNDRAEFNLNQEVEKQSCYYITNSCNGLIGVFGICNFYIVNPSIRKVIALPGESRHLSRVNDVPYAGIGFDESSGKYKVVRLFRRKTKSIGCEIYTLGGRESLSWKVVDNPPHDIFSDIWSFGIPVVLNGAIHWRLDLFRISDSNIALSFDLSTEKFNVILHPRKNFESHHRSHIISLEGSLGIIDICSSSERVNMCIWIMKNYSKREWVKMYDFDWVTLGGLHFRNLKSVVIFKNGIILLCNGRGTRSYYDICTNSFLRHVNDENVEFEQVVTHVNSLVWPWY